MRLLLSAALLTGAAAAQAAAQTTIFVPGDAANIQTGIDLAQDGDVVLVSPGVWPGPPLDFQGKAITLRSADGPTNTVINGFGSRRHIEFTGGEGRDTVVEGFSFFSGQAPTGDDGGSILIDGDASPTIRDCVFSGNVAGRGAWGGTGLQGTDAENDGDDGGDAGPGVIGGAGGDGGAIFVDRGQPLIERCVFVGCRAGEGGRGGSGGSGGDGGPSGFLEFAGDGGDGGKGGRGGRGGRGGAIAVGGSGGVAHVVNSIFADCRSGAGGFGGSGGSGGAGGEGGIFTGDGDPGAGGSGGIGGDEGDGGSFFTNDNVFSFNDASVVLVNCSVTGSALGGLGLGGTSSGSGVSAGFGASGDGEVAYFEGSFVARNCIFWDNEPSSPLFMEPGAFGTTADVAYSNVQVNYPGIGNISSDPLWTTDSPNLTEGLILGPASPCIDAGNGAELSAVAGANQIKDLTGHLRRIDDLGVADVLTGNGPAIDMGAREFVPAASVGPLDGCGVNTPGSLTLLSGAATLGGTITIGIDNPLGTQAPGSIAYFSVSLGTYPTGTSCGLVLPGFGMAGSGADGEFLLSYSPGFLLFTQLAGPWFGAGTPVEAQIQVSADPSVLGLPFYVQGSLLDLSPSAQVVLGLTDGLRFVHGQ